MSLLEVQGLTIALDGSGRSIRPVEGVSFTLGRGEALGLVGESGSGKSMLARALLGLLPRGARVTEGSIRLEGEEIVGAPEPMLRRLRGARIALIFQEPMTALNPVLTVGAQIAEAARAHARISRDDAKKAALAMLERVHFPDPHGVYGSFPHQLSGGMRQRALIALGLLLDPAVLVADEPTTALDPPAQVEILDLLSDVRREHGTALLFISHDLGLVSRVAERTMVMYAGQDVESGATLELFERPVHPYTRLLVEAHPSRAARGQRLAAIPGAVPDLGALPLGCRFSDRCPSRQARCVVGTPARSAMGEARTFRCFFPEAGVEGAP